MLLKGKNNLTLETIAKLEEALEFNIIGETLIPNDGHSEWAVQSHHAYLSDTDQASYGENE